MSTTTITAASAGEELLGELRRMLDGTKAPESLDELGRILDDFSAPMRRARGRFTRLRKKAEAEKPERPSEVVSQKAEPKPAEAPAASAKASERAPEVTARVAPKSPEGHPKSPPAAPPKPSVPGMPVAAAPEGSRWGWLAAILAAVLIVAGVIGAATTTVGAGAARWTVRAARACRAGVGKLRGWTRRRLHRSGEEAGR